MNWLLSIVIGILTAVAGCLGTGFLATLCVSWHRITSREGASGYFVVFLGLLGLVAGLFIGVVCARIVAGWPEAGFLKALGLSVAVVAGLLLAAGAFAFCTAEFPPKLKGRALMVEAEVRLPAGTKIPGAKDAGWGWYVSLTADYGKRRQTVGRLQLERARDEGGRTIVPAQMRLDTVVEEKTLGVTFGEDASQYLAVRIPGRPERVDDAWSAWTPAEFRSDRQPLEAGRIVELRHRVRFAEPEPELPRDPEPEPPHVPDEDDFAALTPAAPFAEWMRFTHYDQTEARRKAAANAVASRPDAVAELSALLTSGVYEQSDLAGRAIAYMDHPPTGVAPAVRELARQLAAELRVVNATTLEEDPSYQKAADVSVRFTGFAEAARVLHGRDGLNFLSEMQEILGLARVKPESITMRDVARVSSYYTKAWSDELAAKPATPTP